MAIPTILKGDDSSAYGSGITITLPEGDYTGVQVIFSFLGFTRTFEPANGEPLVINFTKDETKRMPLGTHHAAIHVVGATGTAYTINNAIPIKVTDNVHECYGANATTIEIGGSSSSISLPWLDQINSNPMTPNELVAAWHEFIERLKATGSVLFLAALLCASLAFGDGLTVQTSTMGNIPWGAQVVTNVTFDAGSVGTDGQAVTNIVNGMIDATSGVVRKTGDTMTGPLTVNNGPSDAYPVSAFPVTLSGSADIEGTGGLSWDAGASHKGHFVPVAGFAWEFYFNDRWFQLPFSKGGVTNTVPAVIAVMDDIPDVTEYVKTTDLGTAAYSEASDFVPKSKHELHADMATNICWEVVYSNGWAYLIPYSNRREDAP